MNSNQHVGFHHVAIRTAEFDRCVSFYREAMGFTPKVEWEMDGQWAKRAVMLDTGDGNYLEIFERPPGSAPGSTPGSTTDGRAPDTAEGAILHFAIRTTDVDAALAKAVAAGAEVTMQPKDVAIPNTCAASPSPLPVRIAFFKGLAGEVVELFQNEAT